MHRHSDSDEVAICKAERGGATETNVQDKGYQKEYHDNMRMFVTAREPKVDARSWSLLFNAYLSKVAKDDDREYICYVSNGCIYISLPPCHRYFARVLSTGLGNTLDLNIYLLCSRLKSSLWFMAPMQ